MIHPMRVLVTGASGRVGRAVVDSLIAAGVPVRALTRRPEAAALPANVEVVTGDLTVPESLDAALRDVGAVFLVWTVPLASAPAVVERLAARARRVVFLSSPHQTPHPFFQQPNPMAVLHADIERLIAAAGLESTIIRPSMTAARRRELGRARSWTCCSTRGPRRWEGRRTSPLRCRTSSDRRGRSASGWPITPPPLRKVRG